MSENDPERTAEAINQVHVGTFAEALGLVIVSASRDEVRARVTLAPGHRQPHGIVHGGVHASVVESVASIGAALDAMAKGKTVVGLENSTSFVRAVREGTLDAVGTPITRGGRTQLWEVTIRTADGAIVATGRVRLLVLDPDATVGGAALGGGG